MGKMILGGTTFARNPSDTSNIIRKVLSNAYVETYTDVAYFSWGAASYIGQVVELYFPFMETTMYDGLQTQYEADAELTFNPDTGSTFTVRIIEMTGKYFISQTTTQTYRKDITIKLLITAIPT